MSCNYCDEQRELLSGAEDMGCAIESIRIERVCHFPRDKAKPPKHYARIFAEIGDGEAWTKPINYCPMCGAKLTDEPVKQPAKP